MSKRNRALRALAERERLALMEWVRQRFFQNPLRIYNELFNNRLR